MRIECPSCAAQYEVDAALFPEEGREVQCAQCEINWNQFPIVEAKAMLLTTPVVASPSDKLPPEERQALRDAVAEEIAIQEQQNHGVVVQEDDEDEEDLIRSLREQLSDDDTNYRIDDNADDVSGRPSVSRAATMAGIDVEPDDDLIDERRSTKSGPSSDLAAALQEYERERGPRRGGRFGFIAALLLGAIALGSYLGRAEIAKVVPEATPYLEQYAALVDAGRDKTIELYGVASTMVAEQLAGDETDDAAAATSASQ